MGRIRQKNRTRKASRERSRALRIPTQVVRCRPVSVPARISSLFVRLRAWKKYVGVKARIFLVFVRKSFRFRPFPALRPAECPLNYACAALKRNLGSFRRRRNGAPICVISGKTPAGSRFARVFPRSVKFRETPQVEGDSSFSLQKWGGVIIGHFAHGALTFRDTEILGMGETRES